MEKKCALSVKEASEYTGIGCNSLRDLSIWQVIPTIRVGNKVVIRIETLEAFMKANEGKDIRNKYEVVAI